MPAVHVTGASAHAAKYAFGPDGGQDLVPAAARLGQVVGLERMTNPLLTPAVNDNRVRNPPEAAIAPTGTRKGRMKESRCLLLSNQVKTPGGCGVTARTL